ncbi:hypothetical protein [Stenotrophomonas phage RAS14]
MSNIKVSLLSDLDQVGRLDALTGIREALWGLHPRNILRSIVEEVAGDSPDEDEGEDGYDFRSTNKSVDLEFNKTTIEVVDGLNLYVNLGYNRRTHKFAAVVTSMTLETNGKVFEFSESFALESNVDILQGDPNQSFGDFVDTHEELADDAGPEGNTEQIDILLDILFDFTDIESNW